MIWKHSQFQGVGPRKWDPHPETTLRPDGRFGCNCSAPALSFAPQECPDDPSSETPIKRPPPPPSPTVTLRDPSHKCSLRMKCRSFGSSPSAAGAPVSALGHFRRPCFWCCKRKSGTTLSSKSSMRSTKTWPTRRWPKCFWRCFRSAEIARCSLYSPSVLGGVWRLPFSAMRSPQDVECMYQRGALTYEA